MVTAILLRVTATVVQWIPLAKHQRKSMFYPDTAACRPVPLGLDKRPLHSHLNKLLLYKSQEHSCEPTPCRHKSPIPPWLIHLPLSSIPRVCRWMSSVTNKHGGNPTHLPIALESHIPILTLSALFYHPHVLHFKGSRSFFAYS